MKSLRVLEAQLPTADELLPLLRGIDARRQYTNGGPLVGELEHALGGVAVASGTAGLELAAREVFGNGFVRVPALTFPATVTALLRAGLQPVLCDIDQDTWLLANIDGRSLPVAAFGAPVEGPLVDAAAVPPCECNIQSARVHSLHATKALPAGEGGLVCGPQWLLHAVRRNRNFGFADGVLLSAGTNAKMSEYHAAVALTALKRYVEHAAHRRALAARYRDNLIGWVRFQKAEVAAPTMMPVLVESPDAIEFNLGQAGIQTRRWYLPTLDQHPALRGLPREDLRTCEAIGKRLIGLPLHLGMTVEDVDRVCDVMLGKRAAA